MLKANKLTGSMGRVSSAGDNAAMESFYSLLQKNVLNRRRWRTRNELAYEIVSWIEHTYNRRRRQRVLGKLTPVEFELAFADPAALQPDQSKPPSTKLRADPGAALAGDRVQRHGPVLLGDGDGGILLRVLRGQGKHADQHRLTGP